MIEAQTDYAEGKVASKWQSTGSKVRKRECRCEPTNVLKDWILESDSWDLFPGSIIYFCVTPTLFKKRMVILLLYRVVERIQEEMYLKHLVPGSWIPLSLKQWTTTQIIIIKTRKKTTTTKSTVCSNNRSCLELFREGWYQGMIYLCILWKKKKTGLLRSFTTMDKDTDLIL